MKDRDVLIPHLALLATLFSFVIVLIKILSVSHGELITARAIVTSASPLSVILGAVVGTADSVFRGASFISLLAYDISKSSTSDKNLLLVVALVCSALAAVLSGWPFLPFVYIQLDFFLGGPLTRRLPPTSKEERALRALIETAERAPNEKESRAPVEQMEGRLEIAKSSFDAKRRKTITSFKWTLGVLVVLNLLFAIEDEMWLPSERVEVAGATYVGYVLATSDDDLVLLMDDPRTIMRLGVRAGLTRTLCELEDDNRSSKWWASPLELLYPTRGLYPACTGDS